MIVELEIMGIFFSNFVMLLFNSVLHLVAILPNAYYMPGILLNPCHPTVDKTNMVPSLGKLSLHFVKNHLKYIKESSNSCSLCFLTDSFPDFYFVVPWILNTRYPLLTYFFKYKMLIVDYGDRVAEQISRAYSSC